MPKSVRIAAAIILGLLAMQLGSFGMRAQAMEGSASNQAETNRLEATVTAEEGIRAVKRLQNAYSHYLSSGLWDDAADLLTQNAVLQSGAETISGKAHIRLYLMHQAGRDANSLSEGQLNAHLILQPIVTLGADGTSAKAAWHEFAMLGTFGANASWRGGIYENDYVLDHGVWKISRIRYFLQYSGDYDEWGHHAPAAWNIPYHFNAKHVGVTIPEAALQALAATAGKRSHGDLGPRVQRLQDETDVQNLQNAYGYYLDRKLWDDIADLFASDGTIEIGQRGAYVGKEHIKRALETLYGPHPLRRGELFDHILVAPVVTIAPDGQSAAARSTQLSMLGVACEFAQWELGTYENTFVKQDGVWKLKSVRYFPTMATDYDDGWARDAKASPTPSKEFPPDRPPSSHYQSYPNASVVAFHFDNPVTGKRAQFVALSESGEAIAALQRRADAAVAVDAVENLNSSYGYYIDESAWDNMADTFASTGSKEITGVGVYVGPERIRTILNLRGPRGGRTPNFFTIHQLTQPVIHIAPDGLSAKARLRLFQCGGNADGSSGSWIGGIYENTAVFENGEWKFGVQDLHHLFNVSYRNGWARAGAASVPKPASATSNARNVQGGGITQGLGGAAAPGSFAKDFPPDRPIRAKQYAFPEIVEPAFHYVNPVSGRAPAELVN